MRFVKAGQAAVTAPSSQSTAVHADVPEERVSSKTAPAASSEHLDLFSQMAMQASNQRSLQLLARPEGGISAAAASRKRAADEIDEYTGEAQASGTNDQAMAESPARKPSVSDAKRKRSKTKRFKTSMTNGLSSVDDEPSTEVEDNADAMDEDE